ncbi:MAG TPA: hypothetical protein VGK67_15005 [Myxococcales bacterium]
MARIASVALALLCAVTLGGCGLLAREAGLVTASDVAGDKTGALEGISVATKDDLGKKDRRLLVDVDILHDVKVEATGDFEVAISSDVLPRIRATVLGAGPVAMDLRVLDIQTSSNPDDHHLKSVEVHQLVFVQYEGEWVLVLQLARTGLVPESGSSVNAYQYVTYPAGLAKDMTRDAAIQYVDAVLDLAAKAKL